MILFIVPSFDKNVFFCLYDNKTIMMLKKFTCLLAGYKSVIRACLHPCEARQHSDS